MSMCCLSSLYSQLVTKGSYIVVTDGLQELLGDTPRAKKEYQDLMSGSPIIKRLLKCL